MAAMSKVVVGLAVLVLAAGCGSSAKTSGGAQSAITSTPTTPGVLTSYGSNAEIVAALGTAGLTCTGTTRSGWGSITGLPDVTPAESTLCWIGDGQPDATATNTLILRFKSADDLVRSDDELVAQRCGSVPAGQPAPKLRAVAEGTTWVAGDSGTHGGIWGPKDEAADAPAITTAAVQIASALGGKVLQRSC